MKLERSLMVVLLLLGIFILTLGVTTKGALHLASATVFNATPSPSVSDPEKPAITPSQPSVSGEFIYPNANVVTSSSDETVLLSYDSPESISNWYRQKIEGKNFSSKNFIQTNNNGFIENKLSGQEGEGYISIDIQKSPNETTSKITITGS